jgi:hypothetical protein
MPKTAALGSGIVSGARLAILGTATPSIMEAVVAWKFGALVCTMSKELVFPGRRLSVTPGGPK